MNALVIVPPLNGNVRDIISLEEYDIVIAVDSAYHEVIKQQIPIDYLVGDFDSIDINQVSIEKESLIRLNVAKDVTDTEAAVIHAKVKGAKRIVLIGGFGGSRIEHFFANINLIVQHQEVTMMNEYTTIYKLKPGKHHVGYDSSLFISLFAIKPISDLTLINFKFPLKHHVLLPYDSLGISNELLGDGTIQFSTGELLVFSSKKD